MARSESKGRAINASLGAFTFILLYLWVFTNNGEPSSFRDGLWVGVAAGIGSFAGSISWELEKWLLKRDVVRSIMARHGIDQSGGWSYKLSRIPSAEDRWRAIGLWPIDHKGMEPDDRVDECRVCGDSPTYMTFQHGKDHSPFRYWWYKYSKNYRKMIMRKGWGGMEYITGFCSKECEASYELWKHWLPPTRLGWILYPFIVLVYLIRR